MPPSGFAQNLLREVLLIARPEGLCALRGLNESNALAIASHTYSALVVTVGALTAWQLDDLHKPSTGRSGNPRIAT